MNVAESRRKELLEAAQLVSASVQLSDLHWRVRLDETVIDRPEAPRTVSMRDGARVLMDEALSILGRFK